MALQSDWDDEPKPVKLTGPLARAWDRVLIANEWFDGEDAIAAGAQQRLIREWNDNKPSTVTEYFGFYGKPRNMDFPNRRDAEAFADLSQADMVVVSVTR